MKRFLAALLVLSLIFCLSACGPDSVVYSDTDLSDILEATDSTAPDSSTEPEPSVEIPTAAAPEVSVNPSLGLSAVSLAFTSYGGENDEDYIFVKENYHDKGLDKVNHLYGLYDELMARYPEYITKTQIATTPTPTLPIYAKNDGQTLYSGVTEDTVFPLYRYDFNPPVAPKTLNSASVHNRSVELPKILYVGGIHGGEYQQVFAAYRFFKMLCEDWTEEALLSELRWNVHFVVIPLANPFGFNFPSGRFNAEGVNVSKLNSRNVDISGNFPSEDYHPGENGKYGTTALSEPESQAIYKIIQEEDFILSIDNHTFGYLATEYSDPLSENQEYKHMAGYFISSCTETKSLDFWYKISRHLNQRVRIQSPEIDNTTLTHTNGEEYRFVEHDIVEIWTSSDKQMLCNTFRGIAANMEMVLSIDPQKELSEDGVTPSMPMESQAYLVDCLAVMFYEALQNIS